MVHTNEILFLIMVFCGWRAERHNRCCETRRYLFGSPLDAPKGNPRLAGLFPKAGRVTPASIHSKRLVCFEMLFRISGLCLAK